MLTRFEVENYKNFKNNIVLDFKNSGGYKFNTDCLYNNIISKIIDYIFCNRIGDVISILKPSSTSLIDILLQGKILYFSLCVPYSLFVSLTMKAICPENSYSPLPS